jgi:hypothetical protein
MENYVGFKKQKVKDFVIPRYFTPCKQDLLHINSCLDWTIEEELGYSIKSLDELVADNN